ncbi:MULTISPECIES: MerR family transcriptional regulator [Paracoccus]|jgi:DNA-binding transcriptional MerR regulator|uniref:MerR family DNA-binding transcriptional regulator n=3 Tax=root TaxID=1 RepID=A0A5C4R4Z6_9RHOB|nr:MULTISPECIES: MerR family DNA-binding transcriptional regulator [Paracoccus]TYP62722.1 MerR family transcriptional regulator [Stutzerimonas stutzeri]AZY94760.1 MerR family DNA-binding transcriptional regulator [Paracoccus sp. Arc7-R13]KJZ31840.1 MerR family transcriptional regulator [Paracoccus sp. S4493]MCO6361498.1 MerR family transcriptional regulator [Paracoccus sp. 08]TNB91456.1 MerR family DNA-binding transcriptional regulator [Paracoccus marcusii]
MSEDLMTIRQMCDAFDVTPRTLRFYEARELIFPQRRGQHRLYDRRDRARLILILRGKRFGFSLEQIRQLLQLYEPGGTNRAQIAATIDVGRDRLADMERQYAELSEAIADLRQQISDAEGRLSAAPTEQP